MGGTGTCVWIFVNCLGDGVGGIFILNFVFLFGGCFFFNLGGQFFLMFLFQNVFHFFPVLRPKCIIFCSTFTHSFTQIFFHVFGSSVSVGRCAFWFFGQRQAAE